MGLFLFKFGASAVKQGTGNVGGGCGSTQVSLLTQPQSQEGSMVLVNEKEEEEDQDTIGVIRPHTFAVKSRTSYITCKTQSKVKIQTLCSKVIKNFKRQQQDKSSTGP